MEFEQLSSSLELLRTFYLLVFLVALLVFLCSLKPSDAVPPEVPFVGLRRRQLVGDPIVDVALLKEGYAKV